MVRLSIEDKVGAVRKRQGPERILKPVTELHLLRLENRLAHTPGMPKEDAKIPVILDMKKAAEDYNSIDYHVLAMNLWRNAAKEEF